MIALLSSYHYSCKAAVAAFANAAQFAHVSVLDIASIVYANATNVVVQFDDGRVRRAESVRAVWAQNVLVDMIDRHGCLCSVCLCPASWGEGGRAYSPARWCDTWLTVGYHDHARGPIHAECSSAYMLLRDLEYEHDFDPAQFYRHWRIAMRNLRENIPKRAVPLRFHPPSVRDEWSYPDMRYGFDPERCAA